MPRRRAQVCRYRGCPGLAVKRGFCRAHESLGLYGAEWRRLAEEHLKIEPDCRVCAAPGVDVDHVLPRADGGEDVHSNLQTLCHSHHSRKTRGG